MLRSLRVESLEARRLLTANVLLSASGQLFIDGTDANDTVRVSLAGDHALVRSSTPDGAASHRFDADSVDSILFHGHDGNDTFRNRTAIASVAYGHDGNDTLKGGSGDDYFNG